MLTRDATSFLPPPSGLMLRYKGGDINETQLAALKSELGAVMCTGMASQ